MSEADRFEPTYILSAFHETVKSADKCAIPPLNRRAIVL